MYYGMPYGAFGDPDTHVNDIRYRVTGSGVAIQIKPSTGLGNAYYQVYVNNVFAGSVYCQEGLYSDPLQIVLRGGSDSVTVFRVGAQPSADLSTFSRINEEAPRNVTATWAWAYETLGTADITSLSSWSISGLSRSQTLTTDLPTRGSIPVTMTVDGTDVTINLGTLAQGTGTIGGSVSLTAINGSAVTASVTVSVAAVTASGSCVIRWPESMQILRSLTSPPSTVIATEPISTDDTGTYTDTSVLATGTYYYALRAISDTGDTGDQSAPQTIVVTGAPVQPAGLDYLSGNASATIVDWVVSTTAGATYNIYLQNIGESFLDTATPDATAIAGATSATLPAVTGYPGVARVLVRAVSSGGVDEKNGDILTLEYDASGNYVAKRPNVPFINAVEVVSGTSATAKITYDPTGESGISANALLYSRTPTGSYNFASPIGTYTLATIGAIKTASITATLANGWHYLTSKASTAGGQLSASYAPEIAVYISDVNVSAPVGTFTLTRG